MTMNGHEVSDQRLSLILAGLADPTPEEIRGAFEEVSWRRHAVDDDYDEDDDFDDEDDDEDDDEELES